MTTFILISIAAIFKAAMDALRFGFGRSVFRNLNPYFWDPEKSSNNKYKMGLPGMGEKFFGSKTIFVMLTDGWHLMQAGFLLFLFAGVVNYQASWFMVHLPIYHEALIKFVDFLVFRSVFGLVFTVSYWGFRR